MKATNLKEKSPWEEKVPDEGDPGSRSSDPHYNYSAKKAPTKLLCRLKSLLGLKDSEASYKVALQEVLEEHAEELVRSPEEGRILANLLDFGELEVVDIMTPQTDIIAVELSSNLNQLREVMVQEQHTRLPVYEQSIDKIKGFIHVKDLVPLLGNGHEGFSISHIMRDILFIPPSMKLANLLLKMRVSGVHIAIVVDEYGGTIGLVTLEDLFEEIVGDIQDEHDDIVQHKNLQWDSRNVLLVDARIRIEELETQLNITLAEKEEEEDYDTLGGFIFAQLGRVPSKGESIQHASGIRMEIADADARRIKRVRLVRTNTSSKAAI